MDELAQQFSVETINSHSGKLMPERLSEFNRLELIRKLRNAQETKELVVQVQNIVKQTFPSSCLELNDEYVETILKWASNRIDRLSDLVKNEWAFIWVMPSSQVSLDEEHIKAIENFIKTLETLESLEKNSLKDFLKGFAKENGLKYATLMKALRGLLSGLKASLNVC